MAPLTASLALFRPEIALTVGLLLVVLADSIGGRHRNAICHMIAGASFVAGLLLALSLQARGQVASLFSGMLVADPLAYFFKILLLLASLLTVLLFTFDNSRELKGLGQGEFYALLIAVTFSNLLLASASDIVMLYL